MLVSQSTRDLIDWDVRDLGEHRLKDLLASERLYQLGDDEFPPLNSLHPTNLPIQTTVFLGRTRELREITHLLAISDVRLLTLTGPGGTGKTRLALQAAAARADDYPDGVWWVPLAPLRDPALVLEAAARAMGARGPLAKHVGERRLLLLLDNFEHLLNAAPAVSELVRQCPRVDVLVTSRELLQLTGEHAYTVPALVADEARALFSARARAVRPDFRASAVVGELCARLDNLPLALELAAARTRHLSAEQLLGRLGTRLDLLRSGRDADPRQQTLRATMQWSYDLLDNDERRLFARLSIFTGGSTLEAAEAVCDAELDTLGSLVDKSLVRLRGDGRYSMLETIREFAAEQLQEAGETAELKRRHYDFFLGLAESANLTQEAEGPTRHDLVLPEQDNLRAALDWAAAVDLVLAVRLGCALEMFWATHPFEGMHRWEALLSAAAAPALPAELRACALRVAGVSTFFFGRVTEGRRLFEESRAEYQRLGNDIGIAVVLNLLSIAAIRVGELEEARSLAGESRSISARVGFKKGEARVLVTLGHVEFQEGNHERGLAELERGAALAGDLGLSFMQAETYRWLALYTYDLGRRHDAEHWARRALALEHRMGERHGTVNSLALLARIATDIGDRGRAGRLWGAIEREEQQGPLGEWDVDRDELAAAVLARPEQALETGRVEGRQLSLDEAVTYALSDFD